MTDTPASLADARIIRLPTRSDERGALGFIEAERHVPFEIKRVYYLFDVDADAVRGAHAHKALQQLIVAGHGSLVVTLNDGECRRRFELNSPAQGLYVPRMLWRELTEFSPGTFCLVLASTWYDESDYYRNYDEYLRAQRAARSDAMREHAGASA